jgi:GGDEF domain-containing protein
MKRLRFLISTIILWLFLLYNIERLSEPINISSVAYIFIAAVAALTILVHQLHRLPLWLIVGSPIPVFLALKAWLGYPLWGAAIPLVVTEMSFIALTSLLARQVNHVLGEFEKVVVDLTVGMIGKTISPFAIGQGEMYREVRRARTHQRPLSLMAIGLEEKTLQIILPRTLAEAQRAMGKHIALSGIAKVLDEELKDYHIIAKQNNHFVVLLPETEPKDLATLKKQLCEAISERVGVTLKIGISSLSDSIVTFERLLEEATVAMEATEEPSLALESLAARRRTLS